MNGNVEKIHLRSSDKARNELVFGIVVQISRRIDLLNDAQLHNDYARAHRHRLYLVVGDVDKRGF